MLVSERMSRHPITITDDTPIADALKTMREQKVRRLPVLNKDGELVGIVSEKDLLYASPSPATSLSIHEIHYLLAKITVKEVMTRKVITIEEDCPLEEAARIMVDSKIGGLPVVRDGMLVGIITETDLFKIFLELLGAREKGVRLTLLVPEQKGMLAKLTGEFTRLGGNIVALGTFLGEDPTNRLVAVKVSGVAQPTLVQAAKAAQCQVIDARDA
ncbi:MAG: CBS domain-containing protein [Chloroflexi bacterium]|nr:CBS domain-containing protein [Chloroflexota bacterium]